MKYNSTKIITLGSTAFRQPEADSHCKFLHGYNLKAKFWFTADDLDENNWVVDFGGLKGLKEELKYTFDHKTIISSQDKYLYKFKELNDLGLIDLIILQGVGIEKFAEHCLKLANKVLSKHKAHCYKCEVFEHERNSAIYEIES